MGEVKFTEKETKCEAIVCVCVSVGVFTWTGLQAQVWPQAGESAWQSGTSHGASAPARMGQVPLHCTHTQKQLRPQLQHAPRLVCSLNDNTHLAATISANLN